MNFKRDGSSVSLEVNLPHHITKATLLNPDRQEVCIHRMTVGGTNKEETLYEVVNGGLGVKLYNELPKFFMTREKVFSEKRLGKDAADIWQSAFLECLDRYFEKHRNEEDTMIMMVQKIDLPIRVMSNKVHDTNRLFKLEGQVIVQETILRGT